MNQNKQCCQPCKCLPLCSILPAFKTHQVNTSGDLDPLYYSHHIFVDIVDQLYQLPIGMEGQKMILRLVATQSGRALIDVEHLSGNFDQLQLNQPGSMAELQFRCCQWHLADQVNVTCV